MSQSKKAAQGAERLINDVKPQSKIQQNIGYRVFSVTCTNAIFQAREKSISFSWF